MKHILVDRNTEEVFIYSCKTDIARHINKHSKTVSIWSKQFKIKQTRDFIICFYAKEVKAKQKANNSF